jgi:hypothetical protein
MGIESVMYAVTAEIEANRGSEDRALNQANKCVNTLARVISEWATNTHGIRLI